MYDEGYDGYDGYDVCGVPYVAATVLGCADRRTNAMLSTSIAIVSFGKYPLAIIINYQL